MISRIEVKSVVLRSVRIRKRETGAEAKPEVVTMFVGVYCFDSRLENCEVGRVVVGQASMESKLVREN